MTDQHISRRTLLKGFGTNAVALPASLTLLSGCSLFYKDDEYSYVADVVSRENTSPVSFWTDVMLRAVRDGNVPPPPAARGFAMGQMAGVTAANAKDNRYQTPFALGEAPTDIDPEIAYGVALSYGAESALNASMVIARNQFLDAYPNSDTKSRSIQWGRYVGQQVAGIRNTDGGQDWNTYSQASPYKKTNGAMAWRPTRPFFGAENGPSFPRFANALLPAWGSVRPWAIRNVADYRPNPFPDEGSAEFARQYMKVRELGGENSPIRTADQKQIAFFWEDGPRGVTPPGHWQIIALNMLQRRDMDIVDQARFMALVSVAQADAGVATWDCKFDMDVIRPESAIRYGGFQNAALQDQTQSNWRTLIPTPPFPAYTSGHSMFSSSSARMLGKLMGTDRIAFSGKAPDLINWPTQLTGVTRSWTSLSQAAEEGGASREYGGIHWEADNTEGLRIGRKLADDIFATTLPRTV